MTVESKVKAKKRVVVKIGTSTLAKGAAALDSLVSDICAERRKGVEFLLVTSGAIGAGMKRLHWDKRPEDIRKKQAAAAVGQVALMETYQNLFKKHGAVVAQVLLTRGDFEQRQQYLKIGRAHV